MAVVGEVQRRDEHGGRCLIDTVRSLDGGWVDGGMGSKVGMIDRYGGGGWSFSFKRLGGAGRGGSVTWPRVQFPHTGPP
ncbi:hypothetical protein CHU98_g7605 [Xylaria longipes]|nr:hypothetical protein CHU98_g7605 [Xylaria longipes]